jgi:hypothetical protein
MRRALAAIGLLAASFGAAAQPYAPQEFDFSGLAGMGAEAGIVESVREVPVKRDLHAFDPGIIEHTMQRPDTAEEIAIRLEAGYLITVTSDGEMPRLEPGQRVRVTFTTAGPLVEAQ